MLFVVGGIPSAVYPRFQQLVTRIFGDGHHIVSKPLRPRPDGKYVPSGTYIDNLIEDLAKRVQAQSQIVSQGCGVILLHTRGADLSDAIMRFAPFALPIAMPLPSPTILVGDGGAGTMNRIASDIRQALPRLRGGVRAINSEVSSRRNRTPLLLPLRNFSSPVLSSEIEGLFGSLGFSDNPGRRVQIACERIEEAHPFQKRGGASFYDVKGVRFKAPGRALHGSKVELAGGHLPTCFLNSHLRLGGNCEAGFHYDCTQGENGVLRGAFPNCHGAQEAKAGRPHLNIYANDFIR